MEGFSGVNNYRRIMKDREYMYHWHLKEMSCRVLIKMQKHSQDLDGKMMSISFTEIEHKTLFVLFRRVDCAVPMRELQTIIINNYLQHEKKARS
jgi:hypothetical protein